MKNNQYPKVTVTKSNSVSEIQLENDDNAKIFFEKLKNNLYNVNQWNELKSKEECDFQLCTENGEEKHGFVENGDLIRICLADENQKITCFDWVQIENLEEKNYPDEQIITFNLKPLVSASILDEKVSEKTSEIAVNSFSIRRLRNKIIAEIEEKNEMINLEAINLYHKIRNLFLGSNGILNFNTF